MPYMMRLTNSGIAMHLGYVSDRPASHGCIRLEKGFAREMFYWAEVGTPVYVEGNTGDYWQYIEYKNAQRYSNDDWIVDY